MRRGYIWFVVIGLWSLVLWAGATARAADAPPAPPPGLSPIAQPMPDFSLPAVNGTTITAADLRGKVVVVRFWATW
jgi:cytochrome oxidase Cu insertion factor (SCO1/SenC/PrrC family)